MPTRDKSISDCQMYIIRPDGTEEILGKIQSAEIVVEQPSNSYYEEYITQPLQDCHDLMISCLPLSKALYVIMYGKHPTNNWLRMHGYRPDRKHR